MSDDSEHCALTVEDLEDISSRALRMISGDEPQDIFTVNHSLAEEIRNEIPRLRVTIEQLWKALAKLASDGVISQGKAAELADLSVSQWRKVTSYLHHQQK